MARHRGHPGGSRTSGNERSNPGGRKSNLETQVRGGAESGPPEGPWSEGLGFPEIYPGSRFPLSRVILTASMLRSNAPWVTTPPPLPRATRVIH
jgi:hypothetical protein